MKSNQNLFSVVDFNLHSGEIHLMDELLPRTSAFAVIVRHDEDALMKGVVELASSDGRYVNRSGTAMLRNTAGESLTNALNASGGVRN